MGYFGFLIGPAIIGFAADLAGLRAALGLLVATSFALVLLAPQVALQRERQSSLHFSHNFVAAHPPEPQAKEEGLAH
jgi:hypothetical protein